MREINANGNISDIIKSLEKKTSPFDIQEEVWFRGQPNYNDRLTPSLFRHEQKDGSKLFYNEAGMYEEFIRRYPDHSKSHKNIFEWLTLMQHYGLPTRLLDWTTNLLVALYFCCRENKNEDGAIFAFNPTSFLLKDYFFIDFLETLVVSKNEFHFYETIVKLADNKFDERTTINGIPIKEWKVDYTHFKNVLNDYDGKGASKLKSFNKGIKLKSLTQKRLSEMQANFSKIYFFKPPHLNPRIRQQHGCFTLHGGKYFEGQEFISCNEMEIKRSSIKIRVKSADKVKLLKELALSGICEATLFPEMEYQAKQIKELYRNI